MHLNVDGIQGFKIVFISISTESQQRVKGYGEAEKEAVRTGIATAAELS